MFYSLFVIRVYFIVSSYSLSGMSSISSTSFHAPFKNIRISAFSGKSLVRSSEMVRPATEKTRSVEAEVA